MSRSGYVEDLEPRDLNLYRATVARTIQGKRGQAFLREALAALDAMPVKELISSELITEGGECCLIGAVCQSRGLDVSTTDPGCPDQVGGLVGIARQLAAEIEFENDDDWGINTMGTMSQETKAHRWSRMRRWLVMHIRELEPS